MSAGEIIRYLRERRFQVGLDSSGECIIVRPRPDDELLTRIAAHKPELIAYLRERQPASAHRYVLWSGVSDRTRSVCLSCGIPPSLHGPDALADPYLVDDPDEAVLLEARAIVVAATAKAVVS